MEEKVELAVGKLLWYRNKDTGRIEYVKVKQVYDEFFVYELKKKDRRGFYDWIGTRLYCYKYEVPPLEKSEEKVQRAVRKTLPIPKLRYKIGYKFRVTETERPLLSRAPKIPPEQLPVSTGASLDSSVKRTPACEICALRKNGTCGNLSNQLCEDYRPTQYVSKEEIESYPEYGLATSIRLRGKK